MTGFLPLTGPFTIGISLNITLSHRTACLEVYDLKIISEYGMILQEKKRREYLTRYDSIYFSLV